MSYQETSVLLKVIAHPSRLEILDLLSCGDLCACDLLKYFQFSQLTLSHHMKLLINHKIISANKMCNKQIYQLNLPLFKQLNEHLTSIYTSNEQCICQTISKGDCQ